MGKSLSDRLNSIKGKAIDAWISEAYREFGNRANERPQRKPQPQQTSTPEPKADEFAGFAGMEPSRLTALRGLADKQLNPGARAQFVQNALANFKKQQAKPAEEPAPEPVPEPSQPKEKPKRKALDLGKVASAMGNPTASSSKPKPKAKPKADENPQKLGEPDLDTLLGQLTGKKPDLSGVEGVPIYKHEQLQPFNDLIAAYKQKEDSGFYGEQAKKLAAEGTGFDHYDIDHGIQTLFGDDDDHGGLASKLMQWAQKNNPGLGKSKKPVWHEVQNFIKNFEDEDFRNDQNYKSIIERSRPNVKHINDDIVNNEWGQLSKKDQKTLSEMGLGGAGGRANHFLKTPEDKERRGKQILKVYLQQGGKDAYLSGEESGPMSWKDFTVDHVHSEGDADFWKERAIERGMNPDDYQTLANDPEENLVMTRFGFNGAQKRNSDMNQLFDLVKKKFYDSGEDFTREELLGTKEKTLRKQLREDDYYKPMATQMKELIQSGMAPEAYDELFDVYKQGRQSIEDADPRTDQSQMAMGRNEYTDLWRTLGEGNHGLGMKIFAGDGLRSKVGGQIAGWSGVGGTTSGSNAANGETPSYPYEDGAMDFYFDPMRRMALSSPEGQKKAAAMHKFTQFMGNAFVTGKIGSQEWQRYLKQMATMANQGGGPEWAREMDNERSDDYLTTINRTLNKLNGIKPTIGKGTKKDPKVANPDFSTDGDLFAPERDFTELFKNSPQRGLADAGIDAVRSLMDENYNVNDYYDKGNLYEGFTPEQESAIMKGKLRLL